MASGNINQPVYPKNYFWGECVPGVSIASTTDIIGFSPTYENGEVNGLQVRMNTGITGKDVRVLFQTEHGSLQTFSSEDGWQTLKTIY